MEIREMFEKNGFFITKQAEKMLMALSDSEEQAKKILEQLFERKLILCGGDIITYMMRGIISDTLINSEDIKNDS